MTEINQEIENMIAEMRVIGQLPAPCRRGNRNNLIKYQDLKCKILERFLSAFESGYRLSVPVSRERVRRGEWEKIGADYRGQGGIWRCAECRKTYPYKCDFCPNRGAPMTDEAVLMVMERLEALKDGKKKADKQENRYDAHMQ